VLDNADGVPGVILAAAHLGPELRRDGGGFLDQIARGFERQVLARVAEPAREALGVLSLMSHVGVERDVVGELSIICAAFGADQHSVLDAVETLVAAGFVRLDGSYAEVIPPPLANRLAGRTIRGVPSRSADVLWICLMRVAPDFSNASSCSASTRRNAFGKTCLGIRGLLRPSTALLKIRDGFVSLRSPMASALRRPFFVSCRLIASWAPASRFV
jgi:hypothetical protein